jgi:hypothetical protein
MLSLNVSIYSTLFSSHKKKKNRDTSNFGNHKKGTN